MKKRTLYKSRSRNAECTTIEAKESELGFEITRMIRRGHSSTGKPEVKKRYVSSADHFTSSLSQRDGRLPDELPPNTQ